MTEAGARTGMHGEYHWFDLDSPLRSLLRLVLDHHVDQRLGIIAFDGGPIRPSEEMERAGWYAIGTLTISPPINSDLDVLHNGYGHDEWCISRSTPVEQASLEVFGCYGGFSLVDPDDIYQSYDPTWDRRLLDFLGPLQERFWLQVERLNAETYVVSGDRVVVASRSKRFIDEVMEGCLT